MNKMDELTTHLKTLRLCSVVPHLEQIFRTVESQKFEPIDILNQILETEIQNRTTNRIQRRIKQAGFPIIKTLADFDFSKRKDLNKHQVLSFSKGTFVENKENIILAGNPGTGKTHLASAIAYELCHQDKSVWFTTGAHLINRLSQAKDEHQLTKWFTHARKWDAVVIDEVGYFPYDKQDSELFFQYIAERYERGSLIITTNLPFDKWNEIFHTDRLTTAILDRIVHHCHIIEMNGESFRFAEALQKKGGKKGEPKSEK